MECSYCIYIINVEIQGREISEGGLISIQKKVMEAESENRPLYIEIKSSGVTSKNEASIEHTRDGSQVANGQMGVVGR